MKIIKISGFVALVAGMVFFFRSEFWKIRKIECQQNGDSCTPEIWSELTSLTFGKNIIFLRTNSVIGEILDEEPTLKEVKIKKKLPDKLIFELKEREGVVALGFETGEDFYIVDNEGVLLAKTKSSDLPLILLKEPVGLNIGEKIEEEEIIQAINFLTSLRLNLFEPKLGRIVSSQTLEIWLKENVVVLFSLKKEAEIQLDSLQLIFSRAKIEGKTTRQIDLRFDKPVVKYE